MNGQVPPFANWEVRAQGSGRLANMFALALFSAEMKGSDEGEEGAEMDGVRLQKRKGVSTARHESALGASALSGGRRDVSSSSTHPLGSLIKRVEGICMVLSRRKMHLPETDGKKGEMLWRKKQVEKKPTNSIRRKVAPAVFALT